MIPLSEFGLIPKLSIICIRRPPGSTNWPYTPPQRKIQKTEIEFIFPRFTNLATCVSCLWPWHVWLAWSRNTLPWAFRLKALWVTHRRPCSSRFLCWTYKEMPGLKAAEDNGEPRFFVANLISNKGQQQIDNTISFCTSLGTWQMGTHRNHAPVCSCLPYLWHPTREHMQNFKAMLTLYIASLRG